MSESAHVTSIESLRDFRAALLESDSDLRDAVIQLGLELRRVLEWIEQDRSHYWPAEVKRASDALATARKELERCQLRIGTDDPPACYEQKKAVERGIRRLRRAEEKVQHVRQWKVKLQHAVQELEGRVGPLSNYLDAMIPQASAALDRMHAALERYVERPPTSE